MLYPLFFEPLHKERIWGGSALSEKYKRDLGGRRIGESWEISCHEHGTSRIISGPLKGLSLPDAILRYGKDLLGSGIYNEGYRKFPLLIKILDAADVLSVQVHPDDQYSMANENGESGKTEMWYVIDAKPGARLVYGLKPGVDADAFERAINEGRLRDCLNELEVEAGDVVYIPAGMVHAIGEGILICEIQQNSDTTYRVYDWDRVDANGQPRELHLRKALDVIDYNSRYARGKLAGLELREDGGIRTIYAACDYFAMEKLTISGRMSLFMDGRRFQTLTCIEGSGEIIYEGGRARLEQGSSCLMPAVIDEFDIKGNCTAIRAYVPDKAENIIKPLLAKGFGRDDLKKIAGLLD
ncbi:MAG TPA: class I mannose-6-phosphate isomerase [Candidatus Atribacteria bacterium]|nr:class I mannose-6-phosphate isomerase [Candidatus Atribacteria bacterium]